MINKDEEERHAPPFKTNNYGNNSALRRAVALTLTLLHARTRCNTKTCCNTKTGCKDMLQHQDMLQGHVATPRQVISMRQPSQALWLITAEPIYNCNACNTTVHAPGIQNCEQWQCKEHSTVVFKQMYIYIYTVQFSTFRNKFTAADNKPKESLSLKQSTFWPSKSSISSMLYVPMANLNQRMLLLLLMSWWWWGQ